MAQSWSSKHAGDLSSRACHVCSYDGIFVMKDQPEVGNLHCFVMFILVFSITFENDNFWFDIKSKQAQLKAAGLLS